MSKEFFRMNKLIRKKFISEENIDYTTLDFLVQHKNNFYVMEKRQGN